MANPDPQRRGNLQGIARRVPWRSGAPSGPKADPNAGGAKPPTMGDGSGALPFPAEHAWSGGFGRLGLTPNQGMQGNPRFNLWARGRLSGVASGSSTLSGTIADAP